MGGPIGLHGHGLRDRQQRGPAAPGATPALLVVALRRYRCRKPECRAVILVVPCEVEPRRHYSRPAIALALVFWALVGLPAREVRRRISTWGTVGEAAAESWVTLRRWAEAASAGRLFRRLDRSFDGSRRQAAARVAQIAQANAPPQMRDLPIEGQAFHGAVAMT